MTAVEILKKDLDAEIKLGTKMFVNWDMYLEMEKQQMFDYIKKNYVNGEHSLKFHKEEFEQYYNETYGSKGSDIPELKYKDGTPIRSYDSPKIQEMVELMNEPTSSQTQISDEEIEQMLFHHSNEYAYGFRDAIKWYREQLKQRQ